MFLQIDCNESCNDGDCTGGVLGASISSVTSSARYKNETVIHFLISSIYLS